MITFILYSKSGIVSRLIMAVTLRDPAIGHGEPGFAKKINLPGYKDENR
jgi:hypothetical protein